MHTLRQNVSISRFLWAKRNFFKEKNSFDFRHFYFVLFLWKLFLLSFLLSLPFIYFILYIFFFVWKKKRLMLLLKEFGGLWCIYRTLFLKQKKNENTMKNDDNHKIPMPHEEIPRKISFFCLPVSLIQGPWKRSLFPVQTLKIIIIKFKFVKWLENDQKKLIFDYWLSVTDRNFCDWCEIRHLFSSLTDFSKWRDLRKIKNIRNAN